LLDNIGKDEGRRSFKPKTWRNSSLVGSGNHGFFYVRIFKDSRFAEGRVFPFYKYGGQGLELPKTMHPEIGLAVNAVADDESKELDGDEIHAIFLDEYINNQTPLKLVKYHIDSQKANGHDITIDFELEINGESRTIESQGNGPINALVNAIDSQDLKNFKLLDYRSHAIGGGSDTRSAAYIQIKRTSDEKLFWGCGVHTSIEMAGLKALISAFNRAQI